MKVQQDSDTQWDSHLSALADPYRRQLLVALLEHDPSDGDGIDPLDRVEESGTDVEFLKISIFHTHLPKLEELGYIKWDRENGTVRTGPNWEELEPLLTLIQNHREELPDGWL
jgi:DNA-binding transcriptional ArsR family regulator